MKTCPWWIRWYHRRQRAIDVMVLLPSIMLTAEREMALRVDAPDPLSEDWTRAVEQRIDALFALHKAMPGQNHWHCPCAGAGEP